MLSFINKIKGGRTAWCTRHKSCLSGVGLTGILADIYAEKTGVTRACEGSIYEVTGQGSAIPATSGIPPAKAINSCIYIYVL